MLGVCILWQTPLFTVKPDKQVTQKLGLFRSAVWQFAGSATTALTTQAPALFRSKPERHCKQAKVWILAAAQFAGKALHLPPKVTKNPDAH